MPSVAGSKVPPVSTSPPASSSITVEGGIRPPVPITIGGGNGLPDDTTEKVGDAICVLVRFAAEFVPGGRNSVTLPLTCTSSPTLTLGTVLVNTNKASEVASSLSDAGSCMKKPLGLTIVTIPLIPETCVVANVDV